ncbi:MULTISPECIES: molybdopterin oxidoreductase family protein [Brevibacillus]|uniref:molybdopterin oxidoreductase family protein n=1 Tax=Brevibacillus TaxID=55080 RepID=UPI000D0EFA24|nr:MULTISPECIES: nitrate reductase [Brevibacillus]MED1945657.1 nitrate reductase [Brevibacillus formosus]MED2000710.1 nitrate reductase [Brevibacillus formosus]MED2084444.1 nitrate reductase [Brevibacillus formosus]PSK15676.1 nitrite reductase [Brevibacillus sp. NRRL NRS-603]
MPKDKFFKVVENKIHPNEKLVSTHCCYCGMQCGMNLRVDTTANKIIGVEPRYDFPVNLGKMCPKGVTAYQQVNHPDRIQRPLIRTDASLKGTAEGFREASWEEALDLIVSKFKELQHNYGKDTLSVYSGVSMTNEKCYLTGKFARVALQTRYIDYNGRFCMSSAAAGLNRSLGIDRGSTIPWTDIHQTDCLFLAGSNAAECHPTSMFRIWEVQNRGGYLIVADPRETPLARRADIHLDLRPGTDLALANGIVHLLIKNGHIDEDFIRNHTNGFEETKEVVAAFTPESVSEITGVSVEKIVRAADIFGRAPDAIVMFCRGVEQQSKGTDNVSAYTNMSLVTGKIGRPKSGVATLTGQGNGQGGREHGQKADQLPGYRKLDNPEHVREIACAWGISVEEMPQKGVSAYEMFQLMKDKTIRSLYLLCSNPVVSAPNLNHVRESLKSLDFMVCCDFYLSESAEYADVVLPVTTWAEDDGTTTNLEGRIIRHRQAQEWFAESKPDWWIQIEIAKRMGRGQFFTHLKSPQDIFNEIRQVSKGGIADYYGVTYEKIDQNNGVFWPCREEGDEGQPHLFLDKKFYHPDGKAKICALPYRPPAEEPDEEYPLRLTTGRVVFHYLSGNQTRRITFLKDMYPDPLLEVHPKTAKRYGIEHDELVTLKTRRGEAQYRVKVIEAIREDTVFVPYHWGKDQSINLLTNPALDPYSKMPEFKACAAKIIKHKLGGVRHG